MFVGFGFNHRQRNARLYTVVADNSALELMRTIGNKIGALPFTVVLDRDGNITARLTGKITEQKSIRCSETAPLN